uniref:Peptidase aspartic putative domain-containing protein n=1 Tax=Anopheles epiroticus TaxID=199890 RepID=A0A182PXA4_9DIPT
SQIAARQPVPRDLPTFSGNVDDWVVFITAFNRTTAACAYTDDENIIRLQHALRGPALEAGGHLLSFPDGLNEAIETLKSRYDPTRRPDLIVESVIRKIRCMAAPKVNDLPSLVEFGFAVKRLVGAVRASGLRAYIYDVTLLKELVRKLPPVLCIDWARTTRGLSEITLMEFGQWIGELANDLCRVVDVSPVPAEPESALQSRYTLPKRQQPHQQPFHARRSQLDRPHHSRPSQMQSHGTGHVHPAYCNATVLQEIEVSDPTTSNNPSRRAFVNERRVCRRCLGYHGGRCRAPPCGVNGCGVHHHELLHSEDATSTCATIRLDCRTGPTGNTSGTQANILTHRDANDGAILKYVPVSLHGPTGRINTYAFLDDGSTSTFIEHELVAELGLSGTPDSRCACSGPGMYEEKKRTPLSCLFVYLP